MTIIIKIAHLSLNYFFWGLKIIEFFFPKSAAEKKKVYDKYDLIHNNFFERNSNHVKGKQGEVGGWGAGGCHYTQSSRWYHPCTRWNTQL